MGSWNDWQNQIDSYGEQIKFLEEALLKKDEKIKKLEDGIEVLTSVVMEKIEVIRKLSGRQPLKVGKE